MVRFARETRKPSVPGLGMIFGGVLLLGGALAALWLSLELPSPACLFQKWSGLPCPTCGSSRMVEALLVGDIGRAASLNPLVFLVLVLVSGWAVLSTAQIMFRVPPRRIILEPWERNGLRILACAALVAGWGYLIGNGI